MKKADFDMKFEDAIGIQLMKKSGERLTFPLFHPLELNDEDKARKIFKAYTPDYIEEIIDDNVFACRENFQDAHPGKDYNVFVFRVKDGKVGMGAVPNEYNQIIVMRPEPLLPLLQKC